MYRPPISYKRVEIKVWINKPSHYNLFEHVIRTHQVSMTNDYDTKYCKCPIIQNIWSATKHEKMHVISKPEYVY